MFRYVKFDHNEGRGREVAFGGVTVRMSSNGEEERRQYLRVNGHLRPCGRFELGEELASEGELCHRRLGLVDDAESKLKVAGR